MKNSYLNYYWKMWVLSFVVLCLVYQVEPQNYVGDTCEQDYKNGTCQLVANCMSDGRQWWKYNRCGFVGQEPIICCPPLPQPTTTNTTTTIAPPVTTTRPSLSTTTEYDVYDYIIEENVNDDRAARHPLDEEGCRPLNLSMTAEKTGRKAWDKCIEYQRELVYPCEPSNTLAASRTMEQGKHCHHAADQLIVGGTDTTPYEFPHMVLLGFGRTNDTEDWKCGGTLISDRFILTAGHCTSWRGDRVLFAIVGAHRRTDDVSSAQVYRITRIIKHPSFNATSKRNDIALLQTDRTVALDQTIVPACLDVFGGDRTHAVATGWGATAYLGGLADTLQKVTLTRFPESACRRHYPRNRKMGGYDGNTQMCYGDYSTEKDTCQGDSGGPLTILNHRIHCMYTVVGVTSFGKICGNRGVPGWYTKVAAFIPWIESEVWPSI